jgi:hypothetical protein
MSEHAAAVTLSVTAGLGGFLLFGISDITLSMLLVILPPLLLVLPFDAKKRHRILIGNARFVAPPPSVTW